MKITDNKYFVEYNKIIGNQIKNLLETYSVENSNTNFDYLIQASAVYSSNIEGNSIDLNSYMNYKLSQEKFSSTKEMQEIENLISAYNYAKKNELSETNLLKCHKILSETLLIKSKQGKYRIEKVGVFGKKGLVYLAIEAEFVEKVMSDFFKQILELLNQNLSLNEIFYFASLIHLKFAHIHPFRDGNGRVARLLEKWFLSEKIGQELWTIPSEQFYKEHQSNYYQNINLGVNYYELNYDKCLPFLTMLPNCLI